MTKRNADDTFKESRTARKRARILRDGWAEDLAAEIGRKRPDQMAAILESDLRQCKEVWCGQMRAELDEWMVTFLILKDAEEDSKEVLAHMKGIAWCLARIEQGEMVSVGVILKRSKTRVMRKMEMMTE